MYFCEECYKDFFNEEIPKVILYYRVCDNCDAHGFCVEVDLAGMEEGEIEE